MPALCSAHPGGSCGHHKEPISRVELEVVACAASGSRRHSSSWRRNGDRYRLCGAYGGREGKMLGLRSGGGDAGSAGGPAVSVSAKAGSVQGLAWKSYPDRAINLARERPPLDLEQFRASGALDGVYYIPAFLSGEEAKDLLARIDEMPEASWTDLKRRRLQNHGGTPHPDGVLPRTTPFPHICIFVQAFFHPSCRAVRKVAGKAAASTDCFALDFLQGWSRRKCPRSSTRCLVR